MINIIVDTKGGDFSPMAEIEGSVMAVKNNADICIILAGDENVIKESLTKFDYDKNRISILNAPEEISPNDKPTEAIRQKKESSLVKSLEMLRTNENINAFVSAGSTGAILAGTVLRIGRIPGVKRPAFCPILPTMNGKVVALCDSGANTDCTAIQLCQFALMSSLYIEKAYNAPNPRIALLNIGVEEEKGDLVRKETYPYLKQMNFLNFVGNMESRDLLSGNYDAVVCDGFAGNVLLKATEGACLEMLKMLKHTFTKNFKNKLGALLLKKDIMATKDFMDYRNYSGAVLLGANKTIVKSHGSGIAISVCKSIEQAYKMEKNNLRQSIAENIEKVNALFETNE